MGLTATSTGINASSENLIKSDKYEKVIAFAGNPNVGKSTVFNKLTGMHQHTGNWAGKTVGNAYGCIKHNGHKYILVDLPGTYSLKAHSKEEETASDFLCFSQPDTVVTVCAAAYLERGLNLLLQTMEISENNVLCINMTDEAEKRGIHIDLEKLESNLGIPVTATSAKRGIGIKKLLNTVVSCKKSSEPYQIRYLSAVEKAIDALQPTVMNEIHGINPRYAAIRLLEDGDAFLEKLSEYNRETYIRGDVLSAVLTKAQLILSDAGIDRERLSDIIASCTVLAAEDVCGGCIRYDKAEYSERDLKADKILTGKKFAFPVMLIFLAFIFWLTIFASNVPSSALSALFTYIENKLCELCISGGVPPFLYEPLIFGIYRVLTWVVAVMLPPMAIFFPLFTLLEDFGYLPRIAFNMDKCFRKCSACGKQALTMCMGFGCNAAGVVGCRIINSPRERLIAVLTNSFVPCNGRFPGLISIISMFFLFDTGGASQSILGAIILTCTVLLGILMTFIVSKILSVTILKGQPSSFTLELPPYRKPNICEVLVRSVLDRTLFVLGRAVCVAAPAGLIIWLFANVSVNGETLLYLCSEALNPFASIIGLDGTILLAFILGFPANEIVIPLIIMSYASGGTLTEMNDLFSLKQLLVQNGWTMLTAVNTMIFSLMHWPCSTTLMTVKKETGSTYRTFEAFILPTAAGFICCFITTLISKLFI